MSIKETVERLAREAAEKCVDMEGGDPSGYYTEQFAGHIKSAIIATLNECGYKEALEWQSSIAGMPRVNAESKLAELKELEKK